jgi:hypothetical protein
MTVHPPQEDLSKVPSDCPQFPVPRLLQNEGSDSTSFHRGESQTQQTPAPVIVAPVQLVQTQDSEADGSSIPTSKMPQFKPIETKDEVEVKKDKSIKKNIKKNKPSSKKPSKKEADRNRMVWCTLMPQQGVYRGLHFGPEGGIYYTSRTGTEVCVTGKLYYHGDVHCPFLQKVKIETGPRGGKYGYFPSKQYLKEILYVPANTKNLVE